MPRLSVWLLRGSLLNLLAGGALGGWLLSVEPAAFLWTVRLRAAHVHLLLFGWLLPFVLGTAYWILPKHARGDPRGSNAWGWSGGLLVIGGGVLGTGGTLLGWALVQRLGTLAVVAGTATLVALLWPRVKAFGRGRTLGPPSLTSLSDPPPRSR